MVVHFTHHHHHHIASFFLFPLSSSHFLFSPPFSTLHSLSLSALGVVRAAVPVRAAELLLAGGDGGAHGAAVEGAAVHEVDAGGGGLGRLELDARDAVLLEVVEDDVGHGAELGALVADVLLDVEKRRRVLLELAEREHVSEDDGAGLVVVVVVAGAPPRRLELRAEGPVDVVVVPVGELSGELLRSLDDLLLVLLAGLVAGLAGARYGIVGCAVIAALFPPYSSSTSSASSAPTIAILRLVLALPVVVRLLVLGVGGLHAHAAAREPRGGVPEVGVVEQHDGHLDALGLEEDDEGVALQVALVVGVQLDARAAAVDLLGDDAALAREDVVHLVDGGVERQAGDVDGRVLARRRGRPLPLAAVLLRGAVLALLATAAAAAAAVVVGRAAAAVAAVRLLLLEEELLVDDGDPPPQLGVPLVLGPVVQDADELVVDSGEGDAVVAVEILRVRGEWQAWRRLRVGHDDCLGSRTYWGCFAC